MKKPISVRLPFPARRGEPVEVWLCRFLAHPVPLDPDPGHGEYFSCYRLDLEWVEQGAKLADERKPRVFLRRLIVTARRGRLSGTTAQPASHPVAQPIPRPAPEPPRPAARIPPGRETHAKPPLRIQEPRQSAPAPSHVWVDPELQEAEREMRRLQSSQHDWRRDSEQWRSFERLILEQRKKIAALKETKVSQ